MDAAGTWQGVAPILAARGHVVYAADFRGFGKGPRVPSGAYYHFADYVADLAELARALVPDGTVDVVGHSMGGTVATLFTGAFPERVRKLALLEGLGPPEMPLDAAPARVRAWVLEVRKAKLREEAAAPATPMTESDALRRLAMNHSRVPADVLRAQLPHLTTTLSDGSLAWAFDPLHRTPTPTPFSATTFSAFARAVTCPVLFVSGGPLGFHPPDEDERLSAYPQLTREELKEAGHMMHWTEPSKLGAILSDFLA